MRPGLLSVAAIAALMVPVLTSLPTAQSQVVAEDYARANSLRTRVQDKVFDTVESATWIEGTAKLWYRKSVRGGDEFVLVDAAAASKEPAFDHARLAQAISSAAGGSYSPVTLPFNTFEFVDAMQAIEFVIAPAGGGARGRGGRGRGGAGGLTPGTPRWHCTLTDYVCTLRQPGPAGQAGQVAGRGRGRQGGGGAGGAQAEEEQARPSPDGRLEAYVQNYNVYVRPVDDDDAEPTQLSWDGSEGDFYRLGALEWSPDSARIAAFRRRPGYDRQVTYVESSPADQLQPKTSSRFYRKPGDVVDVDQPVLFDVVNGIQHVVDGELFPNPYAQRSLEWWEDSRGFTFEYNERGHQRYRVIEVDARTGAARALIDETSDTFIYYNRQSEGLSAGRTFRYDVDDGREIIWMSERDGWAHLYLYDGRTGQVKNQITRGEWAVHFVERVDEEARQIWFTANGMDDGKDPYFMHHFRVNFDGSGLTRFTTGDGTHDLTWSPDRDYYVDTYSRVDQPPVTELRRTSDQSLVMELERGDMTELTGTGWQAPEVFVAKGRDGVTDIWGVIIRPTNFDPSRSYPVIENIYAGPQGSFVPKSFSTQTGMQTLAELGFIVVQIDGMGTANRSKAFHDVAWKNLGDAGFPDRILWHQAVAATYPWYDITRVGIYGTSAGGQNAMGGMLFHPEFYKAAVSAAGCHDNRMDKIWWNEQWMGWPIGPQYAASSNMENAHRLEGALLLVVGEMDTNVDPSSTMQVVNKLIEADKDFDLLFLPGAGHTSGGAYGDRKRFDFFVRHLQGREPPTWNAGVDLSAAGSGFSAFDDEARPWVESEDWEG